MKQSELYPAPVANANRIQLIDSIRGVALLGILLMNIPGFGLHWSEFIKLLKGPHDLNYQVFKSVMVIPEGSMRGLFSMLFGAGMLLFMKNKKDQGSATPVAELYFRRLLWLMLFGLLNAYVLLWNGDILFFYAFAGMLLFAFRDLRPYQLIIVALVCMAIGMVKAQDSFRQLKKNRNGYLAAQRADNEKRARTAEENSAYAAWEGIQQSAYVVDTAAAREEIGMMRGNYRTVFGHLITVNGIAMPNFLYNNNWDPLTMMFMGMALFGLGFFTNRCSTQTYWLCVLVGYGLGYLISNFHFHAVYGNGLNIAGMVDRFRVSPVLLYDIKRVLISVGHASLIVLIYRAGLLKWLMKALGKVGQMAFTNYLMQSILCSVYFTGVGLGKFNYLEFHQLYYVVLVIWVFQLLMSTIWLYYFRFGPFEWLWRSLTYWNIQPMVRRRRQIFEEVVTV